MHILALVIQRIAHRHSAFLSFVIPQPHCLSFRSPFCLSFRSPFCLSFRSDAEEPAVVVALALAVCLFVCHSAAKRRNLQLFFPPAPQPLKELS
jgi:hypothetical protein